MAVPYFSPNCVPVKISYFRPCFDFSRMNINHHYNHNYPTINTSSISTGTQSATVSTTNQVSYNTPSCTPDFIKKFREEFIKLITTIQGFFPICGTSCDFNNIGIKCDGGSRKRRNVGGSSSMTVTFPVNISNHDNYTQSLQSGLKNGEFNLTVTVQNATINSTDNNMKTSVTTSCKKGSILIAKTTNCSKLQLFFLCLRPQ